MLLTEIFPRAAAEYPEKVAVICGGAQLSYGKVAERSGRLSAAFAEYGVRPGDRIALLHRNCHRVLETYFAAAHAGAVLVPLNYRLAAHDLAYILSDTESRILVADTRWRDMAEEAMRQSNQALRLIWSNVDGDETQVPDAYDSALAAAPAKPLG